MYVTSTLSLQWLLKFVVLNKRPNAHILKVKDFKKRIKKITKNKQQTVEIWLDKLLVEFMYLVYSI